MFPSTIPSDFAGNLPVWTPDSRFHKHVVPVVQRFINNTLAAQLQPLHHHELIGSSEGGYKRIQNFAFSREFEVVKNGDPKI
jgi:hypothetical protein